MAERIVILGGGIAALTAAFELTSQPGWEDRYAITLYQMGHRLGGKGASGRNAAKHDRIEEHGLHLFYGFYENAFHLMRRCYAELGRPAGAPLATVEEAFRPHSLVVFEDSRGRGFQHQPLLFPRNDEVPGSRAPLPAPRALIPRMFRFLSALYDEQAALGPESAREEPLIRLLAAAAGALADRVGEALAGASAGGAREALLAEMIAWSGRARALAAPLLEESPRVRLAWTAADITLTLVRGMIADGLVDRDDVDWMALDGEDFRAWLRRHGASGDAVRASTVAGVYAGAYSADREIGAGTALHWTLRMLFTYRGALFYKMQAGMGDVVFAPLYEVLRRRGVRFRFFHRLDRLRLSADRSRVEAIDLGRQILVRDGEYDPLVGVKGLPCWPSEPRYEQLEDGAALRDSGESLEDFGTRWRDRGAPLTLRAGRDFDRVVLGIGLGAVPAVCGELCADEGNPRFGRMVRSIQTTQTASVQLWMRPDLAGTGWRLPPPVVIPYADPLDTWADMSHLLPRETFPAGAAPGSVQYLTAAMPDDGPTPRTREEARGEGERQHARLVRIAADFLGASASHLWPAVSRGPGLDLTALHGEEGADGEERLAWQHFSPMHHPSDRYVLSVRGTTRDRLSADESGYRNLVLCGDWVMNPMNLGCVEGATMSGMAAARALGAEVAIHDDWILRARGRAPGRYVERALNESTSPPYVARDVSMYAAVLPADPARLRALLAEHLDLGGDRVHLPLGPFAVFYAQSTRALSAADAPGHVPERDFGFLIPVAVCERRGGRVVPRGVAVYAPFLWVDLAAAMCGGREVLGFPKGLARLDFPDAPRGDVTLRVRSTLPGPGTWREETLVEATLAPAAGPRGSILAAMRAGSRRRAGVDRAGEITLARSLGQALRTGSLPMLFLKQYRDAADPTRACYQAVVEATVARRGPLRDLTRLDGDLLVSVHRGSGLVEALGLRAEDGAPGSAFATARSSAAFYVNLDFVVGMGTVVTSAEARSADRQPPPARVAVIEPLPLRISA